MPKLEYEDIHSAYNGLRDEFDENRYKAFCTGRTGFPLVDACMRFLEKNGWINFRMRAMLVSFATNNLWLDWRPIAKHLGRSFTDYEPGIHYSQIQMQAGTTGINAPRIYNPVKQSTDQDPNGDFIRQNLPELRNLSGDKIHSPWELSAKERNAFDYPPPIVDHIKTYSEARKKLGAVRKKEGFRDECEFIKEKLASRKGRT